MQMAGRVDRFSARWPAHHAAAVLLSYCHGKNSGTDANSSCKSPPGPVGERKVPGLSGSFVGGNPGGSTSDLTGAISRVTRSSGAWYTCIQVTCNSQETLLRTNHSHAGTRPTTAPTVRIKPRRTLMLLAPRNKSPVPDVPGVARRRSQRAEPRSNKMRKFFEHSGRIGRVRVLVPTRLFYMAASTVAKPSLCAKRPSQMWTVHTECLMRICGVRKDWFARQGLQPRAKALWARARRPRYRGGGVHSEEASGRQVSASSRGCTGRLRSTTTRGTATVCNAIGSAWQRQRRGASSDG